MRPSGLNLFLIFLAASTFGCGDSSKKDPAPNQVIEAFIQSSVSKDTQSNNLSPYIFVGGTSLVDFKYKLAQTKSDCALASGYLAQAPAWTSVQLDVSPLPDGPIFICAIGVDSTGLVQAPSTAAVYSWIKIPNPSLSIAVLHATQGDLVTFLVSQSTVSVYETQVTVITQDDSNDPSLSAHSGVDFTARAATIVIPPGDINATFSVQTSATTSSSIKTFRAFIFNPVNASISNPYGQAYLHPATP